MRALELESCLAAATSTSPRHAPPTPMIPAPARDSPAPDRHDNWLARLLHGIVTCQWFPRDAAEALAPSDAGASGLDAALLQTPLLEDGARLLHARRATRAQPTCRRAVPPRTSRGRSAPVAVLPSAARLNFRASQTL